MKRNYILLIGCFIAILTAVVIAGTNWGYGPGMWWPEYTSGPDSEGPYRFSDADRPFNGVSVNRANTLPGLGYPMRPAAIVGLNDTIQVLIEFFNPTGKPYLLKSHKPEEWFTPVVYDLNTGIVNDTPFLDSKDLHWKLFGWQRKTSSSGKIIAKPDTIPPESYDYAMLIDVWGLPVGYWKLGAVPTDKVSADFQGCRGGGMYEYREPMDIRDTVNAYEALYTRALWTGNKEYARACLDSILKFHPTSVPGWWLQAQFYRAEKDSAAAIESYDKAISFMKNNKDRAMPDSTICPLHPIEKAYLMRTWHWLSDERKYYVERPLFLRI